MKLLRLLLVFLLASQTAFAQVPNAKPEGAVRDLVKRLLPRVADKFSFEIIPADTTTGKAQDVFEVQASNGNVVLRGNNATSLASALNYYLKYGCNAQVFWNGINQLNVPTPLPNMMPKVRGTSYYAERIAYQPVSHTYATPFWNWERWEQEIDFLALNGFNRALLVAGHEAIWRDVLKAYGYDDAQIRQWLVLPAYAPFQAMGVMENTGAPLPQGVIDARLKLAQKIVARMKELGIEPVLPGYFGTVPSDFKKRKPNARIIAQSNGIANIRRPDILDPNDPLFPEIAAKYYASLKANFGEVKAFWATPFWGGAKTEETKMADAGRAIYTAMESVAPEARWVIPATQEEPIPSLLTGFEKIEPVDPNAKKEEVIEDDNAANNAPVEPVKKVFDINRLLYLDTSADKVALWRNNRAFTGAPWVWCVQQNEAGQSGLNGNLDFANKGPLGVLGSQEPEPGQLLGLGVTAHSPLTSPAFWDMFTENFWRTTQVNIAPWMIKFGRRRYGVGAPSVERAASLLRAAGYDKATHPVPPIVTSRPYFIGAQGKPKDESVQRFAIAQEQGEAWRALVLAATDADKSETYRSDLAEAGAQALEALAARYQIEISKAYRARNKESLNAFGTKFIGILRDMDELLNTRREYMAGAWAFDAAKLGATPDEKKLLETHARTLLTIWAPGGVERDTARRNWGGLVGTYYLPRWQLWLNALRESLETDKPVNETKLLEQIGAHENDWPAKAMLPPFPAGDTVALSKKLWDKYGAEFAKVPEWQLKKIEGTWTPNEVVTDHLIWEMDVTQTVTKPDNYEVEFKASGGKSALLIFRVAFFQNDKEIAGAVQNGRTGNYHRDNIYKLTVKNVETGKPVILRAEVAGDTSFDSTGAITVRRAERKARFE
jgi:alpha-N-acetylglucosaminidase